MEHGLYFFMLLAVGLLAALAAGVALALLIDLREKLGER